MHEKAEKAWQEMKERTGPNAAWTKYEESLFKSGFGAGVSAGVAEVQKIYADAGIDQALIDADARAAQALTLGALVGFAIGVKS
jgi:hypothetical protein